MAERKYWTDEEVRKAIALVISEKGINHFPTHKEMEDFYGNTSLSNRVVKSGGTERWAKEFNLPVSSCSNRVFGDKYELQAIEDIKKEIGIDSKLTSVRFPYDIYSGNGVKIDIKASMPPKGDRFDSWNFNLEKKIPTCDFYVFYCINNVLNVAKRVIIPSCVMAGIKQVRFGTLSKYDNYIERWDLIKSHNDFLGEMKTKVKFIPKRRSA